MGLEADRKEVGLQEIYSNRKMRRTDWNSFQIANIQRPRHTPQETNPRDIVSPGLPQVGPNLQRLTPKTPA